MTTTETYVVTDLHPPTENARWLTWANVRWFIKVDLIALWVVARFCTRHLGRFLAIKVRGDGMPLWWPLIWVSLAAWILASVLSHPDAFTCPQVHDSQSAAQPAPSYCG